MLARCPTLLRFLPCILAFMSSNLPMQIMNTGSYKNGLVFCAFVGANAYGFAVERAFGGKFYIAIHFGK